LNFYQSKKLLIFSVHDFNLAKVVALIFRLKVVGIAFAASKVEFFTNIFLMIVKESFDDGPTTSSFSRELADLLYIFHEKPSKI